MISVITIKKVKLSRPIRHNESRPQTIFPVFDQSAKLRDSAFCLRFQEWHVFAPFAEHVSTARYLIETPYSVVN